MSQSVKVFFLHPFLLVLPLTYFHLLGFILNKISAPSYLLKVTLIPNITLTNLNLIIQEFFFMLFSWEFYERHVLRKLVVKNILRAVQNFCHAKIRQLLNNLTLCHTVSQICILHPSMTSWFLFSHARVKKGTQNSELK